MKPEEIAAIKALADAATEGPWEMAGAKNDILSPDLDIIACFCDRQDDEGIGQADADVAFIAASREAVPALIADLERAWELLKRWRGFMRCANKAPSDATDAYLRETE